MPDTRRTILRESEQVKDRFAEELAVLARRRLELWAAHRRSTKPVRVIFGNGEELVIIAGRAEHDHDKLEAQLRLAIEDIRDMTDHYRFGCPEDFSTE